MYLLSIGVARIPENLPDLALALLTGLNAASTGLIFYAGYVLTKACAKDGITVVILFGSAAFGTCFVFIWLYPVLTIAGGIITVAWDWPGWGRMKERRLKRKESQATPLEDIATLSTVTGSVPDKIEEDIEKSPVIESKETLPAVSPVVVADDATVDEEFPSQFSLTHWQAASVVGLWAAVFIIVLVLRSTLNNPTRALELFSNLYVAGTILFGGGPVVIPLLQSYTVDPGWVSLLTL
jgi:chromate transport protein ChrA